MIEVSSVFLHMGKHFEIRKKLEIEQNFCSTSNLFNIAYYVKSHSFLVIVWVVSLQHLTMQVQLP